MQNTVDQVISKTLTSIVAFPWLYIKMTARLFSFRSLRYPFPAGERHLHPVTYFAVSVFLLYLALRQALFADGYVLANSLTPDSLFTQLTAAKIIASTLIAVFLSHLLASLVHWFFRTFGNPDYQPPFSETSATIHFLVGLQIFVLMAATNLEVLIPGFNLPWSLFVWLPASLLVTVITLVNFESLEDFYKVDVYGKVVEASQKEKRKVPQKLEKLARGLLDHSIYNLQNAVAIIAIGGVVAGTFFAIFLLERASKPKKPPLALVKENSAYGYTQATYIFTNTTSRELSVRRSETIFAYGYLKPGQLTPEIVYRSPFWNREDPEVFTIAPGKTHIFELQLDLFSTRRDKVADTPVRVVLALSVLSGSEWQVLTTETTTLNPSTTREEL